MLKYFLIPFCLSGMVNAQDANVNSVRIRESLELRQDRVSRVSINVDGTETHARGSVTDLYDDNQNANETSPAEEYPASDVTLRVSGTYRLDLDSSHANAEIVEPVWSMISDRFRLRKSSVFTSPSGVWSFVDKDQKELIGKIPENTAEYFFAKDSRRDTVFAHIRGIAISASVGVISPSVANPLWNYEFDSLPAYRVEQVGNERYQIVFEGSAFNSSVGIITVDTSREYGLILAGDYSFGGEPISGFTIQYSSDGKPVTIEYRQQFGSAVMTSGQLQVEDFGLLDPRESVAFEGVPENKVVYKDQKFFYADKESNLIEFDHRIPRQSKSTGVGWFVLSIGAFFLVVLLLLYRRAVFRVN